MGLGLYARILLTITDRRLAAFPSGTLHLDTRDRLMMTGTTTTAEVTVFELGGVDLHPDYVLLDASGKLFGQITTTFILVREGFEGEDGRLRALAAKLSSDRDAAIRKAVAHRYDMPVRIRNVRVFDPATKTLSGAVAVVIKGREIASVQPLDAPQTPGEVVIDGGNGTLVPGMYEMHGHVSQSGALLNLAAGVTSVRDMGNNNGVLDELIARIEDGTLAGPRIVRSGFIEGKSPFNANNGIVVDSEAGGAGCRAVVCRARVLASQGLQQHESGVDSCRSEGSTPARDESGRACARVFQCRCGHRTGL